MNLFDLSGRRALVTGGAAGLGLAMGEALHEQGASVALLDIAPQVAVVAEGLSTDLAPVHGIRANLADPADLARGFADAVGRLAGLDILVNNAGITRRGPTEEYRLDDWQAVIDLNVTAALLLCQAAARLMLPQGWGRIINIASLYSFVGTANQIGYAASKGAIRQMTLAMATEWSGRGINVNAIAPGLIATALNAEMRADPDWHRRAMDRLPIGRFGTPDDLKGAVVFLASAAADYVTGVVLPVDGGFLAR
ncbi:MAG TPA: SDR family oxidoreductase [Lamprocystis sp. (in: g-proteobacteria)]|nr:SDR family oxidoreductase [Lamprocystis sp. (in: g-proteobacteria)]